MISETRDKRLETRDKRLETRARRPIFRFGLFGFALLLSGCADLSVLQPAVDSAVFYYIDSPMTVEQAESLDSTGPSVLVGPSSLAKYLDQPQIATSTRPNEIDFSETQRWAEPLKENITRVFVDHLSMGLDSSRVGFLRVMGTMEWDYRVGYHISQLTGAPGDKARMQVSWWVESKDTGKKQYAESIYEEPAGGGTGDYTAYVQAIGLIIETWAGDVVAEIK